MSNLAPLFSMLESAKADELRLIPGEPPSVTTGGQRRDLGTQPLNARLILAAAGELLSHDELAELPSQRARIVRYEHADTLYVIEIARGATGVGIAIRPARMVAAVVGAPTQGKAPPPPNAQGRPPATPDAGRAAAPVTSAKESQRPRKSTKMRAPSNPPKAIELGATPRAHAGHGGHAAHAGHGGHADHAAPTEAAPAPRAAYEPARGGGARIDGLLRQMPR